MFRGAIGDPCQRARALSGYRGNVDDQTLASFPHLWQNPLEAIERACGVDSKDAVPILRIDLGQLTTLDIDSRCLYQDVDRTEPTLRPGEESPDACPIRDVRRPGEDSRLTLPKTGGYPQFLLTAACDPHKTAFPCQRKRDRAPNACSPARNQSSLSVEIHRVSPCRNSR